MRKLVTVQEIKNVQPIENADRLEVAQVLGWNVVVGKGVYNSGDKVAFFEIDSMLPETNPKFSQFQERSQKETIVEGQTIKGHVLSTMKLRGVISQGLVMSLKELELSEDLEIGTEVTNEIGVVKWEEPIPVSGDIVGKFDTRFAPKSDSIRAQSLVEHWDEITQMNWEATVKVDGTSTTLINDEGKIRVFSRNWELSNTSTAFNIAEQFGLVKEIEKYEGMAIQFEMAGPGIQSNRAKLSKVTPLVFAVWEKGTKIPRSQWCQTFLDNSVPLLNNDWKPSGTLEEMIEKVSTLRGNITKDVADEGIVFHLVSDNVPQWMDRNANFKIINNKFLLKHKI